MKTLRKIGKMVAIGLLAVGMLGATVGCTEKIALEDHNKLVQEKDAVILDKDKQIEDFKVQIKDKEMLKIKITEFEKVLSRIDMAELLEKSMEEVEMFEV